MEGPLLAAVYDEDTPASGVGNVLGYSGICNGLRVRQVRVKARPCQNMPEWAKLATMQEGGFQGQCYPEVFLWNEDTAAFGGSGNSTDAQHFTWTKASEWSLPTTTNFGRYSQNGYIFDLPSFNKTRAREIVTHHREKVFFDLQTRAVFIEATFFHPSMERFVTMRLLAEVFLPPPVCLYLRVHPSRPQLANAISRHFCDRCPNPGASKHRGCSLPRAYTATRGFWAQCS
jgi:hypothetical protein